MSVYRPKFKDAKTGEVRECPEWWYDFQIAGRRVRESTKTTLVTRAREAEQIRRRELECAFTGAPLERRDQRVRSVADVVAEYAERYRAEHHSRINSIRSTETRLKHVVRLLGRRLVPDLTEPVMRQYVTARRAEHPAGNCINMEVAELARAMGSTWKQLWRGVRREEQHSDIGKALSPEEEHRLLDAASSHPRWTMPNVVIRTLLMTALRCGELMGARWSQIDFERRIFVVGHAKTRAGSGREIPLSDDLFNLLQIHASWYAAKFGACRPDWYIFPFGKPTANDPTRPAQSIKSSWEAIRAKAGVVCRLHDLRHTALTKMGEAGVPESTMMALAGHVSRRMLEYYSHSRLEAKREAVRAMSLAPKVERQSDVKVTLIATVQ